MPNPKHHPTMLLKAWGLILITVMTTPLIAQDNTSYQTPPKAIADLIDTETTPAAGKSAKDILAKILLDIHSTDIWNKF